jgi:pyruvate/2-oxoglutarate dehydrogenase complex dihydrolipoamide acyltransferase (E2) component
MLARGERLRGWRRLAFATWRAPLPDPAVRGHLVVDAGAALAFIERVRVATGEHVTLTHLAVKAVARAVAANPEVNVRRRLGRLVPRPAVDVGLVVAFDEGRQQAALTITSPANLPVAEIARKVSEGVARLRGGGGGGLARAGRVMDLLPLPLLRAGMRFFSWLSADLGVDLTRFGFPEYGMRAGGFGSALVTAVGMLGLDHGSPLLSPLSRVPVAVLVGRVGERALVVEGVVQARPAFDLSFTADHRFVDGWHAGRLAAAMREYFADPGAGE